MVVRSRKSDSDLDRQARIVALFSVLVDARSKNQFSQAADAQAELERLGVFVKFRRRSGRKGVSHAE